MSEASPGPDWWLASDGRWYPPEQAPGPGYLPPGAGPVPGPMPPTYYPYAPSGYYPYPMGPMGPMGPAPQHTNPLAIASLVCACVGIVPFFGILGVILGLVFGLVAKGQIKRTGGMQEGNGLATAGIIVSVVITALWVILWIVLATSSTEVCTSGTC